MLAGVTDLGLGVLMVVPKEPDENVGEGEAEMGFRLVVLILLVVLLLAVLVPRLLLPLTLTLLPSPILDAGFNDGCESKSSGSRKLARWQ